MRYTEIFDSIVYLGAQIQA